jgi:hypothetical protein
MSEGPGGDIAKLGERFMEGVPGFALVAIVLGGVLPLVLPLGTEGASETGTLKLARQALPVIVLILAWVGYFLGHYLDPLLFDPVWGAPGIQNWSEALRKVLFFERLNESRKALADHWKRPVTGIFAKAQDLMSKTNLWDKKIKWPLEWSKAFRSLAILGVVALTSWCRWEWIALVFFLSFVLLFVRTERRWTVRTERCWTALKTLGFGITLVCLLIRLVLLADGRIQLRMFRPLILAAGTLVSAVLYLGLRIRHVRTLYESARNLEREEHGGLFCAGQKIVPLRNVLLVTEDGFRDETLHKSDWFVQSKALMHVKLSTAHGLLPPDRWKAKIQLFKSQLEEEGKVQLASQYYFSPHVDLPDPQKFDLVIEYFDRAAPEGYAPAGLEKKLNGVI